jgi:putative ABC transport system substrate-binding protein
MMPRRLARRAFLGGVASVALTARGVRAQSRVARIGVLLFTDPGADPNMRAFREGMRERGWVEGQNLFIEYRSAEAHLERVPQLASDLVRTNPMVILALGGDIAPAAAAATTTIPIVISISTDPVKSRLVRSLARPGGNITGVTFLASDLAAKRLQLLREAVPRMARLAVIWNPQHFDDEFQETQNAAQTLGMQVQSLEVGTPAGLDRAFQAATTWRCDSLIAVSSRTIVRNRSQIIDFASRQRLPLAGGWGLWADDGALLSYGADLNAVVRRAAGHVDRILRGARPGELPVEQPTKFELVLNLRTAKTLGLAVPAALLAQADRVVGG